MLFKKIIAAKIVPAAIAASAFLVPLSAAHAGGYYGGYYGSNNGYMNYYMPSSYSSASAYASAYASGYASSYANSNAYSGYYGYSTMPSYSNWYGYNNNGYSGYSYPMRSSYPVYGQNQCAYNASQFECDYNYNIYKYKTVNKYY